MKIKCVKMHCPICQVAGSAQLFINKKNEIRYARFRHYKGLSENKKPQFTYHKIEDLEALKTLLKNKDLDLPVSQSGQLGQNQTANNIGPRIKDSSLIQELEPRAGFGPATITLPR